MDYTNKAIRILLVEDIKSIQTITGLMLKEFHSHHSFHLDIGECGEKAVELVTENDYDLILMDIDLPGIDGLETTRRIRCVEKQTKHKAVIVAHTSHSATTYESQCLAAGMDYFLQKPLSKEMFRALFAKI